MARRRIVQPSAPGSEEITHPADVMNGTLDDVRIREAAIADEKERVAKEERTLLPRNPNGNINNCALANGEDEEHCQMCLSACPDKKRLVAGAVGMVHDLTVGQQLKGELKRVDQEQHARARKRLDFEVAQAAKLSPIRADVARVVEAVFVADIAVEYRKLEDELHLGDDHADRGSLVRRLARAPVNYRKAHKLFVTAKRERDAWEKRNAVIFGAMWQEANKVLQEEKDQKIRNKQITDQDVSSKAAVIFGDEWRIQETERYESKLMIDSLENLVETWGLEARALEAMLTKSR